jgi:ATP-dependent Clp protease ATP-binding subunit ClpC
VEGPLFERFTDRARRVVVFTQEEARLLNHNYIGTEHILLGLIHEGEGVAARALESLNISLEAVRQQVEQIIGRGHAPPTGHIPFTPRAKKVLELSFRESLQLGHNYIGTEHILLGLVREGEGVAAQVLQRLGANLDRVRQTVIQRMHGYPPDVRSGEMSSPFGFFDEREKIVLSLLIQKGFTASGIAEVLGVSEEEVGDIVEAVIEKLKELRSQA